MAGGRLSATDLVQAVPMVWAAALGHLVVGEFDLGVTSSVVIGGVPGVVIGSLVAARARGGWLKSVVLALLMFCGLSMLGAPFVLAGIVAAGARLANHLLGSAPAVDGQIPEHR
ncbi:TSUP family transporter [Actinokineospora enzanensis]|uniref:TSUP family transporter n=1 Tax=Actinokineospora enzanensis TaxID=155975 RepID=UPI0003A5F902|nr:TSUP family transporter [Actinokineospora enzanensis]